MVTNIMGEIEFHMLESKAFITIGMGGVVVVQDAILSTCLQKTKGMRLTFISGKKIKQLLNKKVIP